MTGILQRLVMARNEGQKLLAVLVDPDIHDRDDLLERTVQNACMARADMVLVGGSLLHTEHYQDAVERVKRTSDRPVVLFPGGSEQVSAHADAILFLSLISGRNPEYLIGHQVASAWRVREAGLEVVPTGYMLVDGGRSTTAHYVSQTAPIPYDKPAIAATTALAGQLLGLGCIYLDTGSGAPKHVPEEMIAAVRATVDLPLIVGGGIRGADQARVVREAGADMVVIGTAFEEDPDRIFALREALA
ncbi:MAG: geranylgeranylglyceryl/heptaprenylglyceryl phosphate synthase [Flavobacteriales bacterium]|nr:geranylgeranylglyceryl/heptaprenylglyceryl phosphate synthase [Flavobacteriales bacterium]MCB9192994.1 geranylgeranylglyceryl/heptaprenylglyceryl phosphate synthase [Flavobacteriales bacterium]